MGLSPSRMWLPTMACRGSNLWSDYPVWLLSVTELVGPATWGPWAGQVYYIVPFSFTQERKMSEPMALVEAEAKWKLKSQVKKLFLALWGLPSLLVLLNRKSASLADPVERDPHCLHWLCQCKLECESQTGLRWWSTLERAASVGVSSAEAPS